MANQTGGATGRGVFNCPLPAQQSVVNPFFSNIRQNMDLIGGVGELPVHIPQTMAREDIISLPTWLKLVSQEGGSKEVADRFYTLEKAEQRRMQDALNVSVSYSPKSYKTKPHTLAGVEKGTKNRYNNIWPYDHARVKLQEYPHEECDYVNASYLSAPHSQKRYIASQAPLPSTFRARFLILSLLTELIPTGFLEHGLGAGCACYCYAYCRARRRPSKKP